MYRYEARDQDEFPRSISILKMWYGRDWRQKLDALPADGWGWVAHFDFGHDHINVYRVAK